MEGQTDSQRCSWGEGGRGSEAEDCHLSLSPAPPSPPVPHLVPPQHPPPSGFSPPLP